MKIRTAVVAAALALIPAIGATGMFTPSPVSIDMVNSNARGSLISVRASLNRTEYINCYVTINMVGSGLSNWGACTARDAAGTYISCTTTEPAMVTAIQNIGPASDVRFTWDSARRCSQIFVRHASFNME